MNSFKCTVLMSPTKYTIKNYNFLTLQMNFLANKQNTEEGSVSNFILITHSQLLSTYFSHISFSLLIFIIICPNKHVVSI